MILEEFSLYLHSADPQADSSQVLARWLWEKLSASPVTVVDKVIHCEIFICRATTDVTENEDLLTMSVPNLIDEMEDGEGEPVEIDSFVFCGSSRSGQRLLNSLRLYAHSYEHQKLARWLHEVKASDFKNKKSSHTDAQ
ncbi:MAG: hypothetical protein K2Z81_01525 [Cyanobacteria bacterium]|nr:hypothetical protein [Cyanobacteriota bacterium]